MFFCSRGKNNREWSRIVVFKLGRTGESPGELYKCWCPGATVKVEIHWSNPIMVVSFPLSVTDIGNPSQCAGAWKIGFSYSKLNALQVTPYFRWTSSFLHVRHGHVATILQFWKGYTKQNRWKTPGFLMRSLSYWIDQFWNLHIFRTFAIRNNICPFCLSHLELSFLLPTSTMYFMKNIALYCIHWGPRRQWLCLIHFCIEHNIGLQIFKH